MSAKAEVFSQTYADYVQRLGACDLPGLANPLGGRALPNGVEIDFFGEPYVITSAGISDRDGRRPDFTRCVILSQYLLRCPTTTPQASEWTAYRDFKDARPLVGSFQRNVHSVLEDQFGKRFSELKVASRRFNPEAMEGFSYDLAIRFVALPKVPLLLLFNAHTSEFPAGAHVLFQRSVDAYLDMESVVMVAWWLVDRLVSEAA